MNSQTTQEPRQRLRVLISAYSCEPGKGSEPEVGWRWATQMADFHDVTVITRKNNQSLIEKELHQFGPRQSVPNFVFHDLGSFALRLKSTPGGTLLYYTLWQRAAKRLIAEMNRNLPFDVMHHVTFAGCRYPGAIWGHGVPAVWGPVGGGENFPIWLLPPNDPRSSAEELVRNTSNRLLTLPGSGFRRRARDSNVILASTRETQALFQKIGSPARLMPTIGVSPEDILPQAKQITGPLKILFVGKIVAWKGVELALKSFAASGVNASFRLVGTGPYLEPAQKLARDLNISNRVNFAGWQPRAEVLKMYAESDLLLFPSLHDSGGYAVLEAMLSEIPVVCLDVGGPAIAVEEGCGLKVPVGPKQEVVQKLAAALTLYANNPSRLLEDGVRARKSVLRRYDWKRKAEEMNAWYRSAWLQFKKRA